MCKKRMIDVWIALTMVFSCLIKTDCLAETLEEALVSSLNSNPNINTQWHQVLIAEEQAHQSYSGFEPVIMGEASYGSDNYHNIVRRGKTLYDDEHEPFEYKAVLKQPIFSGFSTYNTVKASRLKLDFTKYNFLSSVQDSLLSAVKAYLNVYEAQHILEMRKHNEKVLKERVEYVGDRFSVGDLTKTDLEQAKARYARAMSGKIASESKLEIAEAEFEKIIGHSPVLSEITYPFFDEEKLPKNLEEIKNIALSSNATMLSAKKYEEYVEKLKSVAKAEYSPQLYAQASYLNSKASVYGGRTIDRNIKLVLEVPFYKTSAVHYKIKETARMIDQAKSKIQSVHNELVEKSVEAWKTFNSVKKEIDALTKQVKANELALIGVKKEEKEGTRTTLDVLNAEQELLEAKVSLITAKKNLCVSYYSIVAIIGNLTPDHIVDSNGSNKYKIVF